MKKIGFIFLLLFLIIIVSSGLFLKPLPLAVDILEYKSFDAAMEKELNDIYNDKFNYNWTYKLKGSKERPILEVTAVKRSNSIDLNVTGFESLMKSATGYIQLKYPVEVDVRLNIVSNFKEDVK